MHERMSFHRRDKLIDKDVERVQVSQNRSDNQHFYLNRAIGTERMSEKKTLLRGEEKKT